MGGIPSGTVTFLFTDIEGSTARWERDPGAMRAGVALHDRLLRGVIADRGGYVFATGGDGFGAAFSTAAAAAAAAVDGQRALQATDWPEGAALRVRMGLHTGEADERGGDYFGPAVNRAARVAAIARGSQIVVSDVTGALLGAVPGRRLVDIGRHRLRGVTQPMSLLVLEAEGIAPVALPSAALDDWPSGLPRPVTDLVGRDGDVKELVDLVVTGRLVTLTGPGGAGKTRLAVEATYQAFPNFIDGAWWIELAPLDADAVPHAVLTALGLHLQPGQSALDAVVDGLRGRRGLLVLDNCEHVVDEVAGLVARVLAAAPDVAVLTTSREPLGLAGEVVRTVGGLDPGREALDLFISRAEAAAPGDGAVPAELDVISELCRRLDGMPLAIELAAARCRSLSPAELLDRLDDRFRLLRGGRGVDPRHQTLLTTVEWSYRLLGEEERLLFDRIGIFAGGFTLSSAESICGGGSLDPAEVVDLLGSLVDKSLVVAERAEGTSRYRMLETLRQYALDRLAERGEVDGVRRRHLSYFAGAAERAARDFAGTAFERGRAFFTAEWDNLRSAVRSAMELDRLAAASIMHASFWYAYLGLRPELGEWADTLLESPELVELRVDGVAASFAAIRGAHGSALPRAETGLAAAPADSAAAMLCWNAVALTHWYSGRPEAGLAAVVAADEISERQGDGCARSYFAAFRANALAATDPAQAQYHAARARRVAAGLDNPLLDALAELVVGVGEVAAGHVEAGAELIARSLELSEAAGNHYAAGVAAFNLALRAPLSNRFEPYCNALRLTYAKRNWLSVWPVLESLAAAWVTAGELEPAAVVLGFLEARDLRHGNLAGRRKRSLAALAEHAEAGVWVRRGATLDRDEVVAYAFEHLPPG